MGRLRKKVFAGAGYNTLFFGPGRKEFKPGGKRPSFDQYLKEAGQGVCAQVQAADFDEGVIGSFMAQQFVKQGNLPGFLPLAIPSLTGKPCIGVEGACGTGGKAIAAGMRSILSDLADSVYVTGFEEQNRVKAVYGADILAGACFYAKERKEGHAFFFPGLFAERAGAYFKKIGGEKARRAMAAWFQNAILNARKNPKAQEYHNQVEDLLAQGMTPPDPERFIPYLNQFDCSKVSDGASSILLLSEEGVEKCGIQKELLVEVVGLGEAEADIAEPPSDPTDLKATRLAADKALNQAGISLADIGWLELHDCFSITGILALESIGFAKPLKGADFVLEGQTGIDGSIPTNLSGGLIGFGHPTGATGIRQLVDLWQQLTGKAPNQVSSRKKYGMMVSMGGDDKTVTCVIVKKTS